MAGDDYCCSIQAPVSVEEAWDRISRVGEWWTTDVTGSAQKVSDRFMVRFGETFVDFLIAEAAPGERCVWQVTDCCLSWLSDRTEWTGTSILWEISARNGGAVVDMTHRGLVPRIECYDGCRKGWNFYVGTSLQQLLNTGAGLPDQKPDEAAS